MGGHQGNRNGTALSSAQSPPVEAEALEVSDEGQNRLPVYEFPCPWEHASRAERVLVGGPGGGPLPWRVSWADKAKPRRKGLSGGLTIL